MGFWDDLKKKWQESTTKIDEKLADVQQEHASKIDDDFLDSTREGTVMVASRGLHKVLPQQDGNEKAVAVTDVAVNSMMSDYNGDLSMERVLSSKDSPFMPLPAMLGAWSENHGFSEIEYEGTSLNKEDVKGKYVLTYYETLAPSWLGRTTDDIADTSNKHFYSHCKSSIYDENGSPLYTSNPELEFNDAEHDATVYVPEDSRSFVIDYEKLGLKREDIEDGFAYQSEGINVMHPDVQQAIFRMNKANLSREDIISLWKSDVVLTDSENLSKIEEYLLKGGDKSKISELDLVKNAEGNKYRYNLQDYSCAIQPTAPVLYATSAKIDREGMDEKQADAFRKEVGLYNIYDEENYGEINTSFNKKYGKGVWSDIKQDSKEFWNNLKENPQETMRGLSSNIYHTAVAAGVKTVRDTPTVIKRFSDKLKERRNQKMVEEKTKDLHAYYQNGKEESVAEQDETTSVVTTRAMPTVNPNDMER